MQSERKRKGGKRHADRAVTRKKLAFPFAMLTPFLILIVLFVIVPAVLTFIMSFTDMDLKLEWNFIGFRNYIKVFTDPAMGEVVARTVVFVIVNTILSVLGSIFIVIITTYYLDIVYKRERWGLFFRAVWLLPSLTPSVVYAFIWKFVFGVTETGLLNAVLVKLGLPIISWISVGAMEIVMFICCLSAASGSIILFSAAVRQIPENVVQAAKVDGASNLRICMKIVLPYLKWPITQKTLWSVLGFFCTYEIIKLFTEGGPMSQTTTYAYYIYDMAYNWKTFGYGAALSVFLVTMSAIVGFTVLKLFRVDKQLREPRMDI